MLSNQSQQQEVLSWLGMSGHNALPSNLGVFGLQQQQQQPPQQQQSQPWNDITSDQFGLLGRWANTDLEPSWMQP